MKNQYVDYVKTILNEAEQEFSSEKTSRKQIPALHKFLVKRNMIEPNTLILDWGGGKYDLAKEFLENDVEGVTALVYDPFNRKQQHNLDVLRQVKEAGGPDYVLSANVLNVIKEKEIRKGLLQDIKKKMKKGSQLYISIFKADRSDKYEETEEYVGQPTKDGWQNAQPIKFYLPEVQEVFPSAKVQNGVIMVTYN